MRIGIGYDIHRLVEGRPLILGGVNIPFAKGPLGHSDGDVLIHAVCDAILGAIGEEDIGSKFPDTDPEYKDASSCDFLRCVNQIMGEKGFSVHNLDCIVIAEEPRVGPYREEIIDSISSILGVTPNKVNIKAKTSEKMGDIGEGNAIAAQAVVLLAEK